MAAKAEDEPPVSAATPIDPPDPRPDPEARRVLEEERRSERNEEAADSEACTRESKRRRTCPTALETASEATVAAAAEEEEGQSSGAVRGEFSFFFDAKGQSPIETTPKFGTFRFLEADRATEEEEVAAVGKAEEARADEGRAGES
ncbi:uncharacterized protein LOC141822825 [Curcuma longa]|uniref:uncharacterized protein LOC141822825 n=1 Tax=Curcuma longa TaxID=136217 RepID=UPI003D9E35F0